MSSERLHTAYKCSDLPETKVSLYTFISTISVYAHPVAPSSDEDAPLATMKNEKIEEVNAETYSPLKVMCERMATGNMDGRALLVRAGLLVGPHDHADRFTYWPHRVSAGGDVLAPGEPQQTTQFIDVRDIAEWTIQATEARLQGPYNVIGPMSMEAVLETCREASGSEAVFHWADAGFLLAKNIESWSDMPLRVPAEDAGVLQVDISKAAARSLMHRKLADTVSRYVGLGEWPSGRSFLVRRYIAVA